MPGPQLENGYTRIANELLDAILRADFSKRQWAVVMYVIRKTYGFNKKADTMTYGEIARATGLDRSNAIKAVQELSAAGVISMERSGLVVRGGEVYRIGMVKCYADWCHNDTSVTTSLVSKQPTTSVTATPVTSVKTTPSKDKEKDNPKDTRSDEGFDEFWAAYPRKVAKPPARQKWKTMGLACKAQEIIEDVERRKSNGQWREVRFIPHPKTYLNQRRWEDEDDYHQDSFVRNGPGGSVL